MGIRNGLISMFVIISVIYRRCISGGIVGCTILLISTHALSRVLFALRAENANIKETSTAARVLNASTNAIVFSWFLLTVLEIFEQFCSYRLHGGNLHPSPAGGAISHRAAPHISLTNEWGYRNRHWYTVP